VSRVYWFGLSTLSGVGGATLQKLIVRFGNAEAVYAATDADLLTVPRITPDIVQQLRRLSLEKIEAEILILEDGGISILTWQDEGYPLQLRSINSAPPVLYLQGTLQERDTQAVAIVGTREPSLTAVALTRTIACELARRGLTIVSGLAMGIDTAAHEGALQAENGRTLAILGSGLQAIHPQQNIGLAAQIACHGALISEYQPRTRVKGSQLMARDRIISGLSRAVIVIQANEKSGSLDTAQKAQKQGRLLFALPGSPGADLLIRQGAISINPQSTDFEALAAQILNDPLEHEPRQISLF
jgi:DNA processing protein